MGTIIAFHYCYLLEVLSWCVVSLVQFSFLFSTWDTAEIPWFASGKHAIFRILREERIASAFIADKKEQLGNLASYSEHHRLNKLQTYLLTLCPQES